MTPLMQQYFEIKQKYPHAFLFFRLGDFYEMFNEDAKEASNILGLALTSRGGSPMCGVPYHAANTYIAKLLKEGKKVAICEQTSNVADPKTKLFERKIVRFITPATIADDSMLEAKVSNYLVSLVLSSKGWGVACLEFSTGEFWISQNNKDESLIELSSLLASVNPREIILSKSDLFTLKTKLLLPEEVTYSSAPLVDTENIPESWPSVFENTPLALKAALSALKYTEQADKNFDNYFVPVYKEISSYLQLDANAVETLELIKIFDNIDDIANLYSLNREYIRQCCKGLYKLKGKYMGARECHIEPDWILIYRVEQDSLVLLATRTGKHSDIFNE